MVYGVFMLFGWLAEDLVWARNVHPVVEGSFGGLGKYDRFWPGVVRGGVGWFVYVGENCGCGAVVGI